MKLEKLIYPTVAILSITMMIVVLSLLGTPEPIAEINFGSIGDSESLDVRFDAEYNTNSTNPEPDWTDARYIRENLKSIKNDYYMEDDYYYVKICLVTGWCYMANNLTFDESVAMVQNYQKIEWNIFTSDEIELSKFALVNRTSSSSDWDD